jgi:hypothetical protein
MKLKGSLPCLQEPAIHYCFEPDESIPHPQITSFNVHVIITTLSMLKTAHILLCT